jgi:ferredoxin
MRIVVDRDLCEANAVCVRTAPDMFVIESNEKMKLLVDQPSSPEQIEKAKAAVRRCPRGALKLVEG